MVFRRREEPSLDDERVALRAQHAALEELKHELAERVAAVRERELELQWAIADAGEDPPGRAAVLPPLRPADAGHAESDDDARAATQRAEALEQRERTLEQREQALVVREVALQEQERELELRGAREQERLEAREQELVARTARPAAEADAERLARIEARLEELQEAEKLFLRTRDELAARSEAVAARERLVAQKERELDEREDGSTGPWGGLGVSEVEARLRRLEELQRPPGEQTQGFTGGLRKLQQGTTRPQRPV
jgi:hypothetical protein